MRMCESEEKPQTSLPGLVNQPEIENYRSNNNRFVWTKSPA
jgi:hypothetical protein